MKKDQRIAMASFARRLMAALYDLLLLISLWMLVGAGLLLLTPLKAGDPLYHAVLWGVAILFYSASWKLRRQTPGMIAWRLYLCSEKEDGDPTWSQVLMRAFIIGVSLGLSTLPALWRQDRRAWHDRLTQSYVINIKKSLNAKPH